MEVDLSNKIRQLAGQPVSTPKLPSDPPQPARRRARGPGAVRPSERLPSHCVRRTPPSPAVQSIERMLRAEGLNSVCEEARCPNVGECWSGSKPTMTLMVLGDECTRRCRFCAVKTVDRAAPPDPDEPAHVGHAVAELEVGYVVITSVDRDDLPDGGAAHYASCVRAIRERTAHMESPTVVETLIPDYADASLATLMEARPDVLAHNVAERLQRRFLIVSGAEYLLLGVLLGPVFLNIEAFRGTGLFPVIALAAGWVALRIDALFV